MRGLFLSGGAVLVPSSPAALKRARAMSADRQFVERRDDGYYLVGSRVPLDCVVREFRDGQSPETSRAEFPTLRREAVEMALDLVGFRKELVQGGRALRGLTLSRID